MTTTTTNRFARKVVRHEGVFCTIETKTGSMCTMNEETVALSITWGNGSFERMESTDGNWEDWYNWFFVRTGIFCY